MEKFVNQKSGKEATGYQVTASDRNVGEYELKIEAHAKCTSEDIREAMNVNFQGTLDDEKVKIGDPARRLEIKQSEEKHIIKKIEDEFRNLLVFRVIINKNATARNTIESWKNVSNFDDRAFKQSDSSSITIKVREIQKIG